jgi:hypothetical protein
MAGYLKGLWDNYWVTIIGIGLTILFFGGEKLMAWLGQLAQRMLGGTSVNINLPKGDAMATPDLPGFRPESAKCKECQAEHERSLRNKADIENIQADIKEFKKAIFAKLDIVAEGIGKIEISVATLTTIVKYQNGRKGGADV